MVLYQTTVLTLFSYREVYFFTTKLLKEFDFGRETLQKSSTIQLLKPFTYGHLSTYNLIGGFSNTYMDYTWQ